MTRQFLRPDFCVIGAGSAGLSFAAGASQLGARVVLLEAHTMGGDCLNTGCVPSKALIAAAHFGKERLRAKDFGWQGGEAPVDFARVRAHVKEVIAAIAPNDSQARFEGLGVTVLGEKGVFCDPKTVETPTHRIQAKRFIVATGSVPFIPPVPGLEKVPYLTNETLFDLEVLPRRLAIIGAGPIGMEMAQAFVRLGSCVTVFEALGALPKDDPGLTVLLKNTLKEEGIQLHEHTKVVEVAPTEDGITVHFEGPSGARESLHASHLLVAAGRRPSINGMGLEAAGVVTARGSIQVSPSLQTSNPRVYALGDCAGGPLFTHVAGYHAGLALRKTIFGLPAKVSVRALPWVTYTDPELAHVGATRQMLEETSTPYRVLEASFTENDRAQTQRRTEGHIKVFVTPKGRLLGATILGTQAGELIGTWALAISNNLGVGAFTNTVFPYPTLNEISKKAAGEFYKEKLFSASTARLVRFLMGLRS